MLRDDAVVALAPKAFETLLALIEHRDRVLTRDELLQRIWGDTVVEEGDLTRNISVLRKALGETLDDHHHIVTVPGRRYRFADAVGVGERAEQTRAFEAAAPSASHDPTLVAANSDGDLGNGGRSGDGRGSATT